MREEFLARVCLYYHMECCVALYWFDRNQNANVAETRSYTTVDTRMFSGGAQRFLVVRMCVIVVGVWWNDLACVDI